MSCAEVAIANDAEDKIRTRVKVAARNTITSQGQRVDCHSSIFDGQDESLVL